MRMSVCSARVQRCHGNRFVRHLAAMLAMCLGLSASPAFAQGIFDGLPYSEAQIRDHLARHTLQLSSADDPSALPAHLYYRQVFLAVLSDPVHLAQLPAADAALIRALPAHQDASFVEKDQAELAALCEAVAGTGEQATAWLSAAEAFDASRRRHEQDLDQHYARVVAQLSPATQQWVQGQLARARTTQHIRYAVFSLRGLAAETPDIAGAILRSGCDNLAASAFEPQPMTLADQVASQQAITAVPR